MKKMAAQGDFYLFLNAFLSPEVLFTYFTISKERNRLEVTMPTSRWLHSAEKGLRHNFQQVSAQYMHSAGSSTAQEERLAPSPAARGSSEVACA